jgi:signal peptidase II
VDSPAAEVPPEATPPAPDPPEEPQSPTPGRAGLGGHYALIGIIVAVVLVVDQLTKTWAVSRLQNDFDGIHLVGSLHFRLAYNSGMAFSKGQGRGAIIGAVALVIVAGLLWFARSVEDVLSRVAIGMVIGGALGNVCDRLFRAGVTGVPKGFLGGRVVDFVYVGWWPTFNVADSCVVVGGILLAIATLRAPSTPEATGARPPEA